ncbi:unnamed protein product [Xylocopa violacea]|uniref:Odorant receptor n=1 Tax=Xylocopa violacea TaxID=135666 RepID=A0ABP1N1M5_XYLVO
MAIVYAEYDINQILSCCTYVITSIVFTIEYCSFCVQSKNIRMLLEYVKRDWNDMQGNEVESSILGKCMDVGRQYTIFCTSIFVTRIDRSAVTLSIIIFTMVYIQPLILDVVVPLNESRQPELTIPISTFNQNNFNFMFIYLIMIVTFGSCTLITVETIFIVFLRHCCGLLKVTSYKIARSLDWDDNQVSNRQKRTVICLRIIDTVNMHRRALAFLVVLVNTFKIRYMFLLFFGVASLIFSLFHTFKVLVIMHNASQFLLISTITVPNLFMMAFLNYSVQNIIDFNSDICVQTYSVKWYAAPVSIQKLYLFLMLKTTKNVKIVIGLFAPSMEGLAKLLNITFSFIMVLCSSRMAT